MRKRLIIKKIKKIMGEMPVEIEIGTLVFSKKHGIDGEIIDVVDGIYTVKMVNGETRHFTSEEIEEI